MVKELLKDYLHLLDKLKFREFMYIPVSIFVILYGIGIVFMVYKIFFTAAMVGIVLLLLMLTVFPFQLYFLLRIYQWFAAKFGLEWIYKVIFKRN